MSTGHVFNDVVAKGNTRQHNGDVYNSNVSNTTNYNTYASAPHEGSLRPRKRRRSSSSVEDSDTHGARKDLMDSLYYDGFDYRKESLDGPQPQTFEWIFYVAGELVSPKEYAYDWRTEEERRLVWPSFPCWLESSDSSSQYCILGKAGSGKSTLLAWISRDQQDQTVSHLRKWAGLRPVHVVTHFLFRPSANAIGRNFEGLLRSLLFQVLSVLPKPELQTSVLDGHKAQTQGSRAIKWTVRVLKEMLKHALLSAQQHFFCIFIDGVDEFHDEGYAEGGLNPLIDFLLELQRPAHIKLCLSSRPTARKLSNLASVSGTTLRLADLNRLDILTYVSQVISHCDGLRRPDSIVREVCVRADGVFLWAVFAVQEMSKWADTEDNDMLLKRLESMGTQLEEIFAYMLDHVEHAHRKTLAFYVKATKWSRMGIIRCPPSIALLVAAQEDISNRSYKTLVERCELEERRITQWSHGLLEVTISTHDLRLGKPSYAWVRRTSQPIEHGTQRCAIDTEEPPIDWIVSDFDHNAQDVIISNRRRVSWLHRSAFDFFFSPASQNHAQRTNELLGSCNDSAITPALIQGYIRLMLTLPHECANLCFACLVCSFHRKVDAIVETATKASRELGECHDHTLDQVLATLLAWKHHGAHPERVSDYHNVFKELRAPEPLGCPFAYLRSVHECSKYNCFVRLDVSTLERDHMTEQVTLKTDTCNSLGGTLSEAMFWQSCVQGNVSLSYTMQRCAAFYERQSGGVILACILEGIYNYPERELSADAMRLEAHVRDQIRLWINRHASTPDPNASRWLHAPTYVLSTELCSGGDHTVVSWLSLQARDSTLGQDICRTGTTSQDINDETEAWMLAALTTVWAYRPHSDLCRQFSHLLAPWDICVDIGRCGDLAIMMHVAELAQINNIRPTIRHNEVMSLRLMLGDPDKGRMASHWISHDIARRICKHCIKPIRRPTYDQRISGLGKIGFFSFAEDLLQDVHQHPSLAAGEKAALENALCVQLVAHARSKALRPLDCNSSSEDEDFELSMSAEQAEKAENAGQTEQERLVALLSD